MSLEWASAIWRVTCWKCRHSDHLSSEEFPDDTTFYVFITRHLTLEANIYIARYSGRPRGT